MADKHMESRAPFGRYHLTDDGHLIRRRRNEPGKGLQQVWNAANWIRQRSSKNVGYRMELVLQRGCHAEISAPAANGPEKIWIGVVTGFDLPPIHRHKLCRYQVVACGAVLRLKKPLSSAQR